MKEPRINELLSGKLPSISIVVPTYDSERTLTQCLESIVKQDYPRDKVEIIIVDGGSKDKTLDVARKYKVNRILNNPLRTGEAGKAVGVKAARNEIIALIDSDNILDSKDWLSKMVNPFKDSKIVGSEPLYYTYRVQDSLIVRYCALIGANDPLCIYLGNFDRYCYFKKTWTEIPIRTVDRGDYLQIELGKNKVPTVGANGFLVRSEALTKVKYTPYLFDVDLVFQLVERGQNMFAKVKNGVIHLFADDVRGFIKKTYRRIRDYLQYEERGARKYPWMKINKIQLMSFIISTLLIAPLLRDSIKGYKEIPDRAWLFHPVACWLTLIVYGTSSIFHKLTHVRLS